MGSKPSFGAGDDRGGFGSEAVIRAFFGNVCFCAHSRRSPQLRPTMSALGVKADAPKSKPHGRYAPETDRSDRSKIEGAHLGPL